MTQEPEYNPQVAEDKLTALIWSKLPDDAKKSINQNLTPEQHNEVAQAIRRGRKS